MSSFSIPLTGLEGAEEALNTVANNLSNMNTTAFKGQNATFSDLFYQQLGTNGAGDQIEVGAGTQIASTTTDFSTGGISSDGDAANMAIDGNGFFVVQGGSGTEYTRDGDFLTDNNGYLTTQGGQQVMGYPAVNGAVNTSGTLVPIQIPIGQVEKASATTTMSQPANLDASAAVGATFTSPVTIYDSLGEQHIANIDYTKTGTNTWSYSVSVADTLTPASTTTGGTTTNTYTFGTGVTVDPSTSLSITGPTASGDATIAVPTVTAGESLTTYAAALNSALTTAGITGVTATATGNTLSISGANMSTSGGLVQAAVATNASGTLSFDPNGNLISPAANVSGMQFAGLADGAANLNLTWDLFGTNGTSTLTQEAATSSNGTQDANGFPAGQYQSFAVDSNGVVSATYSNGQSAVVGQVALASVTNEQGLALEAGNNYETTSASGAATVGVANTGGLGTIDGESLEGSNVDISTQFSDLIVDQQAYGASSKVLTTFDTITQETINMIH
jgi:flagellar hook protein FlgE